MACRSASVVRAQSKSSKALEAIGKLDDEMTQLAQEEDTTFENKIKTREKALGVNDFEQRSKDIAVKVDFTHEFNVDALVPVITNIIKVAALGLGAASPVATILSKPENIQVFADLLNGIAQAVKTTSNTGANFTFSENRLAPGFIAFTFIKTRTIQDKETFGEESITAHSMLYKLVSSQQLAVKDTNWLPILALNQIIRLLTEARIGAANKLALGEFTIAEFAALSEDYAVSIRKHENELASYLDEKSVARVTNKSFKLMTEPVEEVGGFYTNQQAIKLIKSSIAAFQEKGDLYRPALQASKELLLDFTQNS